MDHVDRSDEPVHRHTVDQRAARPGRSSESPIPVALMAKGGGWGYDGDLRATTHLVTGLVMSDGDWRGRAGRS